jgi:cytochrome b561
MSGAGGHGVSVFGLEIIAAQFDPIAKEAIPHNAMLAGFMAEVHEIVLFLPNCVQLLCK